MNTETTHCPYCNAVVPIPAATALPGRLLCPRCQETFPYRDRATGNGRPIDSSHHQEIADVQPETEPVSPRRRWSNGDVAGVILSVMTVMAVFSLTLALQTRTFRRENDAGIIKSPVLVLPLSIKIASNLWVIGLIYILISVWKTRLRGKEGQRASPWFDRLAFGFIGIVTAVALTVNLLSGPIRSRSSTGQPRHDIGAVLVRPVAPARLPALGYLPSDVNLVAAVHVAEALRDEEGKTLLARIRLGPIDFSPENIEKWTGLKLEEIDHVALGVKLDNQRVIVVVRTLQPIEAAKVREVLGAVPLPDSDRKERYRFKARKLDMELYLWFPEDEHFLVLTKFPQDLTTVPRSPRALEELVPDPVRSLLEEKMDKSAQAWVAGRLDNLSALATLWMLTRPEEERNQLEEVKKLLGKLKAAAVWVQLEQGTILNMKVQCADEETAQAMEKYLSEWLAKSLENVKTIPEGVWVFGQGKVKEEVIQPGHDPAGGR